MQAEWVRRALSLLLNHPHVEDAGIGKATGEFLVSGERADRRIRAARGDLVFALRKDDALRLTRLQFQDLGTGAAVVDRERVLALVRDFQLGRVGLLETSPL